MSHISKAVALAAAAAIGAGTVAVAQGGGDPVREPLAAQKNPIGAKGRTLALSRVTIPAGAALALHHHTGTQIAFIAQGTLTYTVKQGKVVVHAGSAEDPTTVRTITAGQTGQIKTGQWIVEQPSNHHMAQNKGTGKIVIYLANLLPNGDPPSVAG